MSLDADLHALGTSTARLLATLDALDDATVRRPSLLPDWTVGHVLTHLARNADGNRRMLEGAARGEVADQYPHGREGRAADIEAGAVRTPTAIIADTRAAATRLAATMSALPADAWARPVRTFRGEYPAHRVPVSRRVEVEVHHVDLGVGYRPDAWPADFVAAELATAVDGLAARLPRGTALRLVAVDTGEAWELGTGPASVSVAGDAAWLLAWLAGRPLDGTLDAPEGLPPLEPWG